MSLRYSHGEICRHRQTKVTMSEDQGKVGLTVDGGPDTATFGVAIGPSKEGEALRRWRESRRARALVAPVLVLRRWPDLTVFDSVPSWPEGECELQPLKPARPSAQLL